MIRSFSLTLLLFVEPLSQKAAKEQIRIRNSAPSTPPPTLTVVSKIRDVTDYSRVITIECNLEVILEFFL